MRNVRNKKKLPLITKHYNKKFPFNYRFTDILFVEKDKHVSQMEGTHINSIQNKKSIIYSFYKNISRLVL